MAAGETIPSMMRKWRRLALCTALSLVAAAAVACKRGKVDIDVADVRWVCEQADKCGAGRGVDACVTEALNGNPDPRLRAMTGEVYRTIRKSCVAMTCDRFLPCAMESIEKPAEAVLGPSSPRKKVDPATRERFTRLLCRVAREHPEHLPNLAVPNASPDEIELGRIGAEINDAAAVADLMRDAITACASR
jgi:hypothetical protein